MLQNTKQLYGMRLSATDGLLGLVKDLYFDDQSWTVRYLVVDTESWLPQRQVLLTRHAFGPEALGKSLASTRILHANLTRKQIEDSPSIDTHRPVSRQFEDEYHRYYGWPAYWQGGGISCSSGISVVPPTDKADLPRHGHNQRDDVHLHSASSVVGYRIQAADGTIGSVSGFNIDSRTWAIREIAVDTGHWYASKTTLFLPENVERISYEYSTVYVNLTTGEIRETSDNDVAQIGLRQP